MQKGHLDLIEDLVKDLQSCNYDEHYLYMKLFKYKFQCSKNLFDSNICIKKYFNNYELKYIANTYKWSENTEYFNMWVGQIFNLSNKTTNIKRNLLGNLLGYFLLALSLMPIIIFSCLIVIMPNLIPIWIVLITVYIFILYKGVCCK